MAGNLRRDEARDRAALLDVDRYDVELDLTQGCDGFGSVTTVLFDCAVDGAITFAEFTATEVHLATLNGEVVDVDDDAVWDGQRIALAPRRGRNELRGLCCVGRSRGDGRLAG